MNISTIEKVDIQKVVIENSQLEVYEDMRFDHCQSCIVPLPHQQLLRLSSDVNIDSLQVKNLNLTYLSNEDYGNNWARIDFKKLYASAHHITNQSSKIKSHPKLILDAQSELFDKTILSLHFEFDLTQPNGRYTYKGSCGQFELTHLNQFLKPAKHVSISAGKARRVRFSVDGNDSISQGAMDFTYDGLKVTFLNKNKYAKRIFSELVNGLAVKKEKHVK